MDPLATAGPLPLDQRQQDADGGEEPGRQIVDGNADAHRPLAGQAGDGHQPAHALGDLVEARPAGIRAILAEA